ncbi:MAG TPA: hypothetical protein VFX53_04615 [Pedococcus sp.]|nr:hypothetical protein [Pedococcus sp.]
MGHRLPVYVRVGDGPEYEIGTVTANHPQRIAEAVSALLVAAGLELAHPTHDNTNKNESEQP